MPGTKNVAWKVCGEVDPVETPGICPEVGRGSAHQDLGKEKRGYDDKILDGRYLAFGCSPGKHFGMNMNCFAFPTQVIETSEGEKHDGQTGQQSDNAQRAPEDGVAGQRVPNRRIVREVVGIGIGLSGTGCHRSPSRPGEKGTELPNFFGIVDVVYR